MYDKEIWEFDCCCLDELENGFDIPPSFASRTRYEIIDL